MKNRIEIYEQLKHNKFNSLVDEVGCDKANRLANIHAVQNTEKEYRKQFRSYQPNLVTVHQVLNRSKLLEEAIFLAICGLNTCKEFSCLTGVIRLEIARDLLDKSIDGIKKKMEKENG